MRERSGGEEERGRWKEQGDKERIYTIELCTCVIYINVIPDKSPHL